MEDFRPSDQLLRLRLERDVALEQMVECMAVAGDANRPALWQTIYGNEARRFKTAYEILSRMAWAREMDERGYGTLVREVEL